ncbi:hypothetical protein B484DRAFT_403401 [Ochromonadaceae sp. CCMP2298]|nr:hypothetical protein B484DRAFT_403401 [Ochromonadaceae sp. CCMP2298]
MFERLLQSLKKPAEEELKSSDFRNPKVEKVCNSEMAFIQSVISLYRGQSVVEDYPLRNDMRSRLTVCLMSMPPDLLVDEELSLATVRAAYKACGVSIRGHRLYTCHDRREALRRVIAGGVTYAQLSEELGAHVDTMYDLFKAFIEFLRPGLRPQLDLRGVRQLYLQNADVVNACVDIFSLPKCGRPFYMGECQVQTTGTITGARKDGGSGLSRTGMGFFCRDLSRHNAAAALDASSSIPPVALGDDESLGSEEMSSLSSQSSTSGGPAASTLPQSSRSGSSQGGRDAPSTAQRAAKRLREAECGRCFVRKNTQRLSELSGKEWGFTKDSSIDAKRAAAANPILDSVMKEKFAAYYDELHAAGELLTPRPLAHQVWNGDEIGWNPVARHGSSLGPKKASGERTFRVVKEEKAPFWVTICSWYSFAEAYRRPVREGSAAAVLCVAESRREFGGWLPSLGTAQHLLQHRRCQFWAWHGGRRPSTPCNQSLQGSAPGLPAPPRSCAEALSATALSPTVRVPRLGPCSPGAPQALACGR